MPLPDEDRDPVARLTVTHALIAGTGFLWAPVVIAMADALCAFGVSHHWPEGARSFTTVDCSANFISSAREGEQVTATAAPLHLGRTTQVWDATVTNETHRAVDGVVPLHPAHPVLSRAERSPRRTIECGALRQRPDERRPIRRPPALAPVPAFLAAHPLPHQDETRLAERPRGA